MKRVAAATVCAVAASVATGATAGSGGGLFVRAVAGGFSGVVQGSGCVRIPLPASRYSSVTFAADRPTFAYLSERTLRIATLDGRVRVVRAPRPRGALAFGPSGLAYPSGRELVVAGLDGSLLDTLPVRLPNGAVPANAVESPDRRHFALTAAWAVGSDRTLRAALFLVDARGARPRRLVRVARPYQRLPYPIWSPDGSRLVFAAGEPADLWTIGADGSGLRRLTRTNAEERDPLWSPDGARIAFTSDRSGTNEAYVVQADGTRTVRLTETPRAGTAMPPTGTVAVAWSPDGRRLAVVRYNTIAVVDVASGGLRTLCALSPATSTSLGPGAWP